MTFQRSFTPDSWWNTPLSAWGGAVDPMSAVWTREQELVCPPPTVGNPNGSWAMPWSEARASDPFATIRDSSGREVRIRVDVNTGTMLGNDGAAVWRDLLLGLEVSTIVTAATRHGDGTIDTRRPILCDAFALYAPKMPSAVLAFIEHFPGLGDKEE